MSIVEFQSNSAICEIVSPKTTETKNTVVVLQYSSYDNCIFCPSDCISCAVTLPNLKMPTIFRIGRQASSTGYL